MRGLMLLAVLILACLGWGQDPSLFHTVRPDVILTIRKHSTGADLLTAMAVDPKYPVDLLSSQVSKIAANLGGQIRGLQAVKYSPTGDTKYATARVTGAVDGLIDRKSPNLHLQEIVRAFAGAESPYTVKGLNVTFDGETATAVMVSRYVEKEAGVRLEGQFTKTPPIIEYRVELLTQDPNAITIPATVEPKNKNEPSTAKRTGVDWTLWGLLAGAAVAAGALVYSVLLRSSPKPRSK
jgi:hypothetical protein